MKMSILEFEYKSIRKISSLKLSFSAENGVPIKNNFVMMANGTGKTTTMNLIKGLLDQSAIHWDEETIRSFAPTTSSSSTGEFSMTVKFDEKTYKYFLVLDYANGTTKIETLAPPTGRDAGLRLPESLKGIFTAEFVSRFVFDGEQAKKSMDRSSNEADETIRYLYRLDELDEILAMNNSILSAIQSAEGGNQGTDQALRNLRTRQAKVKNAIDRLTKKQNYLKKQKQQAIDQKKEKEAKRHELDKNFGDLNAQKNEIIHSQERNRGNIDVKVAEILSLVKLPFLISESLCARMHDLGAGMTKLKLPKNSSKDFFSELADAKECVCGRCIGTAERAAILRNAERYLGSEHQAVLNSVKSTLMDSVYDDRLKIKLEEMGKLEEEKTTLAARYKDIDDKLIKAGGEQVEQLQGEIDNLNSTIGALDSQLNVIESKDESDLSLNEENNLYKATKAAADYEAKIASTTKTNVALQKKQIVENLINKIRTEATKALKSEIIRKTNEKVSRVITDDNIEIESIDGYIKLKNRDGASEGQTLGVGYCFLGTLFEDSELEFPFVIDSPTGKMDFDKRQAVAEIIPVVFNQMIAFVQSAEVERFADQFYGQSESQFLTVVASKETGLVDVHTGKDYFDSYQSGTEKNPEGPPNGSDHVIRGGSWLTDEKKCRVISRDHKLPTCRDNSIGLRLLLNNLK